MGYFSRLADAIRNAGERLGSLLSGSPFIQHITGGPNTLPQTQIHTDTPVKASDLYHWLDYEYGDELLFYIEGDMDEDT